MQINNAIHYIIIYTLLFYELPAVYNVDSFRWIINIYRTAQYVKHSIWIQIAVYSLKTRDNFIGDGIQCPEGTMVSSRSGRIRLNQTVCLIALSSQIQADGT